MSRRKLVLADAFHRSVAALPARAGPMVQALIDRVYDRPERAPRQPGTRIHCLWSNRCGGYPALRLFYTFDAEEIELLWIERYDDLKERAPYVRRWARLLHRGKGRG